MTCTQCNGYGYVWANGEKKVCNKCGGNGKILQTNEEWFCSLDTEDKAREISDMTAQGYWSEELVYKWLKQSHKEE